MYRFVDSIKGIFNNYTTAIIILAALFTLFVDGPKLKDNQLIKEYKLVKIISYSYIAIGVIVFLFLKIA